MKNALIRAIKSTLVLSTISLLLVSCGPKNTSGGKTKSKPGVDTTVTTANKGAWIDIVRQENPCQYGGQRQPITIPLQNSGGSAGATYVGVTSEGDIAYVESNGGQQIMTVEICSRPAIDGRATGGMASNPVLKTNLYNCPIDEIVKADIYLDGAYGNYMLAFAPIHVPGYRQSSLCMGR